MSKCLNVLSKNVQHYASGKSLNDISKLSGVPQSTISRLVSEQSNPSLDTIEKLAIGLDVEPYVLLVDRSNLKLNSYAVPDDLMLMLSDQPEAIYDSIRTILKTYQSVKKENRKSN